MTNRTALKGILKLSPLPHSDGMHVQRVVPGPSAVAFAQDPYANAPAYVKPVAGDPRQSYSAASHYWPAGSSRWFDLAEIPVRRYPGRDGCIQHKSGRQSWAIQAD